MTIQAQIAMILWLPIVLFLFYRYPPQKAMIISFLGGLLFLPQRAGFPLPLIPDYKGMVATCYGIFIGIILFDIQIFSKLKPRWLDLPIILFGTAPLFSSLSNDLGLYDGINQSITQIVTWGFPYLLGRLYLNNLAAFKELAINIVKAGVVYIPFCLYEIRMSPQIHNIVYGYHPHSFAQTMRYGGYRPQVFMQHGLMLGLFMMSASLVAIWLWQGKVVRKIWSIPIQWASLMLLVTFILCKSTGAYILMLIGLGIMLSAKLIRLNLPLIVVIFAIIQYLFLSVTHSVDIERLSSLASDLTNPDRAASLEYRLENEVLLVEKARAKMLFGWGGWGRNRVLEENWKGEMVDAAVTDSLWIIIFGNYGLWALLNWILSLLLPILNGLIFCLPTRKWFEPKIASVPALGVILILFVVDCLFNAMFNPMFALITGGLSSLSSDSFNQSFRKLKTIKVMKKLPSSSS